MEDQTHQEFIAELEHLVTIAKHPKVIALLNSSIVNARSMGPTQPSEKLSQVPLLQTRVNQQAASAIKVKEYGWDQTENVVKLYVSKIPGVDQLSQKDISQEFSERAFTVEVSSERKLYSLTIKDLLYAINPDQSSVKVKSGMVCISLRKKSNKHWECLTSKEKKQLSPKEDVSPNLGEGEDPGAGLMKMMKKMYDEGDDDMKRTISKSWYESQQKRGKGDGGEFM